MKIIETLTVNSKNTRTVTANGEEKQVLSFRAYPLEFYIGGIWLPKHVNMGDTVTVYIDQLEVSDYNGKQQVNAKFPKVTKEFNLSNAPQATETTSNDLFGGTETVVSDDELPF